MRPVGEFDEKAYADWRDQVGRELALVMNLSRPTLKALVGLALCESPSPVSYEELETIIKKKGVLRTSGGDSLSRESMRVAVAAIAEALREASHPMQLVSNKTGREVRLGLVRSHTADDARPSAPIQWDSYGRPMVRDPKVSLLTEPKTICRSLLRDGGGLPFASAYSSYRAAAHWLNFASGYSARKRSYEGNAFNGFAVHEKLGLGATKKLGLVALAVGEGLGEVELLENILRPQTGTPVAVDYLAIDSSELLLLSHARLLEERFGKELAEGTLRVSYVLGDLYHLKAHVDEIRGRFCSGFLEEMPILCTYFGNCLGNYEYHEWDYFKALLESFPKSQPLATLVGVSLLRRTPKGEPIPERYTLSPFWLETPRHLLYELNLLTSKDEAGAVIPLSQNQEFLIPDQAKLSHIPFCIYETCLGIRGVVYRFYYGLKNAIETWDGEQSMPKGAQIHLYSIIKYDLDSLASVLRTRGWQVDAPPDTYEIQQIVSGDEIFQYAVFFAMRK